MGCVDDAFEPSRTTAWSSAITILIITGSRLTKRKADSTILPNTLLSKSTRLAKKLARLHAQMLSERGLCARPP
jgi:hypothetical protein